MWVGTVHRPAGMDVETTGVWPLCLIVVAPGALHPTRNPSCLSSPIPTATVCLPILSTINVLRVYVCRVGRV